MMIRPAPALPSGSATTRHEPHSNQWVVDATTRRVVKRPCVICDGVTQDQVARDAAIRSA